MFAKGLCPYKNLGDLNEGVRVGDVSSPTSNNTMREDVTLKSVLDRNIHMKIK